MKLKAQKIRIKQEDCFFIGRVLTFVIVLEV